MKIFNWFSNKKDVRTSSSGEITAEKIFDFTKTYEELKPFFALFIHCFKSILDSEEKIKRKVKEIQSKTQQNLKEDLLFKELWALRYVCLHTWLFELKPPKNKTELSDDLLVINSALKSVLKENNKSDYLPWLKDGLSEFTDGELTFDNLKNFRVNFPDKLAEKIPQIAFDCTEGRLAGELHDFVIELIMITVQKDKNAFELRDNISLTENEVQNIKNAIDSMKPTEKDFENFINS